MNGVFSNRARVRHGFTLVELLVVISIIALLAAILLPAMNAAFTKAEKAQAQTEVRSILAAIQAYNNEYGKLPVATGMQGQPDSSGDLYTEDVCKDIIKALNGIHDVSRVPNPRKVAFLDAQGAATDGSFADPWGKQYRMILDTSYDNQIRVGGTNILGVAIVVSLGPDGVSGGGDDITSY